MSRMGGGLFSDPLDAASAATQNRRFKMMGWAFCLLTYIAAGGIIASLEHDSGAGDGKGDYVFRMLAWPLHYVVAVWLVFRER